MPSTVLLSEERNWRKAPTLSVDIYSEDEHMRKIEQHLRLRQVAAAADHQLRNSVMANAMEPLETMEMAAGLFSGNDRHSRYEHELQRMGVPVVNGIGPDGPAPPKERLVHLDLKGAPPKVRERKRGHCRRIYLTRFL